LGEGEEAGPETSALPERQFWFGCNPQNILLSAKMTYRRMSELSLIL